MVQFRWLPVTRARITEGPREKGYESTVDIKLDQLGPEFTRFFSGISSDVFGETMEFIDNVFLSLVEQPRTEDLPQYAEDISVDAERDSLADVFNTLWVSPERVREPLEHHINLLRTAIQKSKRAETLTPHEIAVMFDNARLKRLRARWQEMKDAEASILRPKTDFINLINGFFHDKVIDVNKENVLFAQLTGGGSLDLNLLSSGEKQMIILLGEVLLQRYATGIYVADEPELSLHVEWQEQLVSAIRQLNPNVQLIFATHSPDIVSTYGDKVLKLEKALQ
jgi:hypothetical protein